MTTRKHSFTRCLRFCLALMAVALLAACGAKLVRGASPIVRIAELSHEDKRSTLQLSMRNLNDVTLTVQGIDLSLALEDQAFLAYNGAAGITIAANGSESWSVETEESGAGHELLERLENGEFKSLRYTMKGSMSSAEDGTLRFEQEGHLYPLPGRPGHFR